MNFGAKEIREYMDLAIAESRKCALAEDVPVGCIIVDDSGNIISKGHNTREASQLVTGHAEISALTDAARETGSYKLQGCTMFVTLEPCPMCAGAIRAANLKTIYFGAKNTSSGACGTVMNVIRNSVDVFGGIKEELISDDLSAFFSDLRNREDKNK